METRINLNVISSPTCRGKCSKEERQGITDDDICREVKSVDDGLIIRCVGDHASQKIYVVKRYYDMFVQSQKKNFPGKICYFEICSGPGRCVDRKTCEEFDGTSLATLQSPATEHLRAARFYDINPQAVDALNNRIHNRGYQLKARAVLGDYNDGEAIAENILTTNPYKNGLNLVFIDPTDCSVPFSMIEAIKNRLNRVDFIINVATKTDVSRAVKYAVDLPDSDIRAKYERFLGGTDFFKDGDLKQLLDGGHTDEVVRRFVETYRQKLHCLGLTEFDLCPIEHYYWLAFASAHPRGAYLWRKARGQGGISHNGQKIFDF